MESDQDHSQFCSSCQARIFHLPALRPIDPNFLRSSHIPSNAESSRAFELLKEETQELTQYENDIAHLRLKLEEMEAAKLALQLQIERRRSVLSAQRRVPVEVWEEIFTIACSPKSKAPCALTIGFDEWHRYVVVAIPIILSQVCSRWRDIVTCSPKLWSRISVDLCHRYPKGGTKLVEMFLANSASYPLDLRLILDDNRTESAQSSWQVLTRHISRAERLFVDFNHEYDPDPLSAFPNQDIIFDNLVFFHSGIQTGPPYNDDGELVVNSSFWKALLQAPKLTGVQMECLHPLRSLPYHQITVLVIEYLSPHQVEGLLLTLEVSTKLHTLKLLSFSTHSHGFIDTPRHVKSQSLRVLSIRPDHDSEDPQEVAINNPILKYLLASLELPSLSTFKLACVSTSKTIQVWPPLLLDLLKQSTNLRCLSLSLGTGRLKRFSWEPLSTLLNVIPHLTHLQLSGTVRFPRVCWNSFISPSLFEMANISGNRNGNGNGNTTAILPHLTHLSVTNIGKVTPDVVNTVVTLAIARSPMARWTSSQESPGSSVNGVQLLETRVEDWESSEIVLEPEAVEVIQELKRDGVRVVVDRPHWWCERYDPA